MLKFQNNFNSIDFTNMLTDVKTKLQNSLIMFIINTEAHILLDISPKIYM